MALPNISIVVEAVDKASKTLGQISGELNKLNVRSDAAVDASKKLAFGLAGVAVAAGAFGAAAIKAAGDAQRQIASMDATLRATGAVGAEFDKLRGTILSTAAGMVKLGFDDEEAAKTMALLYQRTKDVTQAQKLMALSADLARAKNISLGDAGNLVNLVLSGNTRAVKAYGIEIDETLGPMAALEELQGKVAGQSDAFAQSFSGQMAALNVAWGNFMEEVGVKMLPTVTKLVKAAAEFVDGTLPRWIENTEKVIGWLKEHETVIYIVAGAIIGALVPAFIAWATAAWTAAAGVAVALAPFFIAGAVIGAVVAGLVWLWNNSDKVNKWISEGWTWMVTKLKENVDKILLWLGPAGWLILAFKLIITHTDQIKAAMSGTWEWLSKKFEEWTAPIIKAIQKIIDKYNQMKSAITNSAVGKAVSGAGKMLGFASGGVVPGRLGEPQMAIVHGGEQITPVGGLRAAGAGGYGSINVTINADVVAGDAGIKDLADRVGDVIMRALRTGNKFG